MRFWLRLPLLSVNQRVGGPSGKAPRLNPITVIGSLSLALGTLAAFGGLTGLLVSLVMPVSSASRLQQLGGMALPSLFRLIAAVQLVAGGAMIVGGGAFLRLRAWARTLLETLAWLGLLYNITFAALWIGFLMPKFRGTPGNAAILPVTTAAGLLIDIAFCAALAFVISVLRGPAVRSAMAARALRRR